MTTAVLTQPGSQQLLPSLSGEQKVFIFCSHLGIPPHRCQRDACFLIALHINFPSWQSHGKDWLNLNCDYRVCDAEADGIITGGENSENMAPAEWRVTVVGWCSDSKGPWLIPTLGMELNISSAPNYSRGQFFVQLRLRSGQAASFTTHQGESEHCCHPSQPIQSVGHKSAWRPGSCGSGKMECDGLVFTNSRGAPLLRLASHHSVHSTESSSSPHSIWFSHIKQPPPRHPQVSSLAALHTSPSFMLLFLLSSSFISSVLLSHTHWCN